MKTVHEFSQEEVFEILVSHVKKKLYTGFSLNPEDCEFVVVLNENHDLKSISFSFENESLETKIDPTEVFRNGGYR